MPGCRTVEQDPLSTAGMKQYESVQREKHCKRGQGNEYHKFRMAVIPEGKAKGG